MRSLYMQIKPLETWSGDLLFSIYSFRLKCQKHVTKKKLPKNIAQWMYVHTWAEMKLGLVMPVAHARHNITKASGLSECT